MHVFTFLAAKSHLLFGPSNMYIIGYRWVVLYNTYKFNLGIMYIYSCNLKVSHPKPLLLLVKVHVGL